MIDVALGPGPPARQAEVVVVVDVLRATSTACQALASGYDSVICAESIPRAFGMRGAGRVLAGERRCIRPAGFELGNSPLGVLEPRGRELVLATTNGAPAIVGAAAVADQVLLGCLLNLEAVAAAVDEQLAVCIACAGTDGAVALEDVYMAGRLSAMLRGTRTDAAHVAEGVARSFASAYDALNASADAAVLRAAGLTDDIAYCALESELQIVPQVVSAGDGAATVRVPTSTGSFPHVVDLRGTVPV